MKNTSPKHTAMKKILTAKERYYYANKHDEALPDKMSDFVDEYARYIAEKFAEWQMSKGIKYWKDRGVCSMGDMFYTTTEIFSLFKKEAGI